MAIDPLARPWPFGLSRARPVKQNLIFNSTLAESKNGKEQRSAKDGRSRRTYEFTTSVIDGGRRAFEREMHGHQHKLYAIPHWQRRANSTSTMLGGGDRFDIDQVEFWAQVGETVIIADEHCRVERRDIADVIGSTLVFAEINGPDVWPVGTRVYHAMAAYVQPIIQGSRIIPEAFDADMKFDIVPGSETLHTPPAATEFFNGREVFTRQPMRFAGIPQELRSQLETIDFGFGNNSYFRNKRFPVNIVRHTFHGCDAQTTKDLEDLFLRKFGQQGEFYAPTWTNDLVPTAIAGIGTNSLTVEGEDVHGSYNGSTVYKALAVQFNDGTFEFNIVDDTAAGVGVTTLTLQNNWVNAIDPANLRAIYWMPVWRFATDNLLTQYTVERLGELQMPFQSLEDLAGT